MQGKDRLPDVKTPLPISQEREKAWLALLLAGVAGAIDAIGFLVLLRVFTANMSGNSVRLGLLLGQAQWGAALHYAFPIPFFVSGIMLGSSIAEISIRHGIRYTFALVLSLEVVLLLFYLMSVRFFMSSEGHRVNTVWEFYLLTALLAVSMGLQNSALRRVGGQSVRITYVTGMLTDMAVECVKYLFWLRDYLRKGRSIQRMRTVIRASLRHVAFNRVVLLAGMWTCYVLGAIYGGYSELHWALIAVVIPIFVLVFIIIIDLIKPIHAPII